MPRHTPRQSLFHELETMLKRAKQILDKEPDSITFDDLDAVLFLARKTAEVLRNYNVRFGLLESIREFLEVNDFDLTRLDANWDGQGQLPSNELRICTQKVIATSNKRRSPGTPVPSHEPQPSA